MFVAQQDFRDEEYFIPKAVFEQQGIEVVTVSNEKGQILGIFGGVGVANIAFSDVRIDDFDGFVFVGGSGAMKYLDNKDVYKLVKQAVDKDKLVGAICIAPAILANAGVLKGRKAAVWSSNMDKSAIKILEKGGADYQKASVVIDGRIVTANGAEQARKFAETAASMLK